MKFSLKALLGFMLLAAIVFAVVPSTLWRLTAKHDIDSRIRLGDRSHGYPVINAVGFFEIGVKVIVLHRVTSTEYDDGDSYRTGSHVPKWLNCPSFGPGRIFDCVVAGQRVYIEDGVVQIYYATDGEAPKYVRVKYSDYAAFNNVGFFESNEAMWRLAEQQAKDAESSVSVSTSRLQKK